MRALLLLALLLPAAIASAAPQRIDTHRWDRVERIVAIGDLHGDYDSYIAVLRAAGIVDARGRWRAGETHLVQTGDIPDRGPDTRRIIAHLARLASEAERRGGRVHALIGNHEAMNVYGDLRYVHPGEFAAFAGKRSGAVRDRYFEQWLRALERGDPARHAALPADFRAQWDLAHPLGWVEHRRAWDPNVDPKGELSRWVLQAPVAVQLNGFVFLHGGLSSAYCGNSLDSLTRMAHAALREASPQDRGILTDPRGPLWYRGNAGVEPATPTATVDAILRTHGARHLVVGHTPTLGVIWPRLDARIIQIDTGMGAAYGRHLGWLEATAEGLFAGYPGGRLRLPPRDDDRIAYLEAVIALQPDDSALLERLAGLRAAAAGEPAPDPEDAAPGEVICDTAR
jgi:hypothetical protein